MGADCLTIRMFAREHRVENAKLSSYDLPFAPEWVFLGIGPGAKLLKAGADYMVQGTAITFPEPPGALIDFYAGHAWPDRFNAKEMQRRRRETRTINEWDSQYQLHSKPVTEVRLDPARLRPYDEIGRAHV